MKIERRVGVGIRLKLFGFLLPLVFLLVGAVTWTVTEVTQATLRRDLLQRGAAVSRVVALSAGHSLLANDPLGLDRLVSETKASDPDIAFVSIRDASDIVVAHDRVTERGKPYRPVPPAASAGNVRRHAGGRGDARRTAPHRIHHPDLLRGTARGDRLPRALHGGSRDRAAVDPAMDLRGGGGHPGGRLHRDAAALVVHHHPGEAAPPGSSLPRGQRDVPARRGALLRRAGRPHTELQPDGGDDSRPEDRPAKEGGSAGGSVRQHGPRHRRVAGREGPVHDGALHPRGADVVRAGALPRDGRGGAFQPGAGGDLPRPREDPDPRRRPPQGRAPCRAPRKSR